MVELRSKKGAKPVGSSSKAIKKKPSSKTRPVKHNIPTSPTSINAAIKKSGIKSAVPTTPNSITAAIKKSGIKSTLPKTPDSIAAAIEKSGIKKAVNDEQDDFFNDYDEFFTQCKKVNPDAKHYLDEVREKALEKALAQRRSKPLPARAKDFLSRLHHIAVEMRGDESDELKELGNFVYGKHSEFMYDLADIVRQRKRVVAQ